MLVCFAMLSTRVLFPASWRVATARTMPFSVYPAPSPRSPPTALLLLLLTLSCLVSLGPHAVIPPAILLQGVLLQEPGHTVDRQARWRRVWAQHLHQ